MHRLYLSIIAVLLGGMVYLAFKGGMIGGPQSTVTGQEPRSIAVLEFVPLGEESDALSQELTEDLINTLMAAESIRVAARTESSAVESVSPTAARALGVRYLLEGSVRYEVDTVRLTAQLIDGETEAHLWSNTYYRSGADVSEVSADIAHHVINIIRTAAQ
jgi:TolB-like protein